MSYLNGYFFRPSVWEPKSESARLSYEQCVVSLIVSSTNMILQCVTTYFLHVLKRSGGATTGLLLSLSLCYTEMAITLLTLAYTGLALAPHDHRKHENIVALLITTLLFPVLFAVKLFILFVEVLKVSLNAKYDVYWSLRKTAITLVLTWLTGIAIFTTTMTACPGCQNNLQIVFRYSFIPSTLLFLPCALLCNSYLLYKLNQSRLPPNQNLPSQNQVPFWTVLVKCRFVVPVVASVVFSLFLTSAAAEAILDLTIRKTEERLKHGYMNFLTVLLFQGMVSFDMCVYLFLEKRLRCKIYRYVSSWKHRRVIPSIKESPCAQSTSDTLTVSDQQLFDLQFQASESK